jgi:IS30 family transposase
VSLLQQRQNSRLVTTLLIQEVGTPSRERHRNSAAAGEYASEVATARSQQRRKATQSYVKLHAEGVLWQLVVTDLTRRWAPQQIAGTLKRIYPERPEMRISHETIYTTIYAHATSELLKQLIACLLQFLKKRLPLRLRHERRGGIPDMVSLRVRPPDAGDWVVPGHWEGDLIIGAGNRVSVGVLVERSSRLVLLVKMEAATAGCERADWKAKGTFPPTANKTWIPLPTVTIADRERPMAFPA